MYLIYYYKHSFLEGSEEELSLIAYENRLGKTEFLQDTLPSTYNWKISNGVVTDKTAEEVQYDIDLAEYTFAKSELFRDKRYRLEIEAAKLYITAAWPSLAIKALASDTIKTKVEYRNIDDTLTEFNVIFMDEILPDDKTFISATDGFVLYDVEEINPDNPDF